MNKKTISNTFTVNTVEDGVDAVYAYASTDKIVVECNSDGTVKTAVNKTITLTMKVGNATFSFFTQVDIGTLPSGVSVQRNGSDTLLVSVGTTATSAGIAAGFDMTLHAYNGIDRFQAPIHIALIGSVQGQNASEVNPNILLRTIFDDGIDKVSEKWSFDSSYVSIDTTSDTVVEGRKSIRLNSQNNVNGVGFSQSVLGKIKPNTWYTASFNVFHTAGGSFAMSFYNLIGGSRHLIYDGNVIVDGVARTIEADSCDVVINGAWDGARHTVTFKTRSSEHISTTRLDFVFWQGYSSTGVSPYSQTAICMPKLEIGEVATAYMANEDDLRGQRGKTGRFYYYAGCDWNASDSTQQFAVTDVSVPFFSKAGSSSNKYYVYNPDVMPAGGQMTMAQMAAATTVSGSINWNNKPWEVMTDDFKYLITEAIFASFAKLGSFIVSGDWLISTNGTINGTAYVDGESYNGAPAYTWFDPVYPNTDHTKTVTISGQQVTVHNFIPYLAFDGRTGETYQQNAHVKGEIRATSGTVGGFIISPTQISSDNNNIVLNSNGTATITGTINATNGSITGQMNIGTGGSIIVGSDNSGKYRIKISQNSSNGQISMIDSSGNSMVLINYNTDRNAGQVKVSEADATHPRYTFINPNAIESMYNYKNANNQWNGDSSHITTQLGYRMAETEYEDNYVSGGSGSTKHVKIGITSGVVSLRAYDESGASAWPTASVPMNNYPSMTKGLVHVISLGSLKEILNNQTYYSFSYGKLSVMLVQTS